MRKWMMLFLAVVLMLPGFRAQAASNDAELAAIKAKIAQLETNYNQLASQIAQNKKAIEEMSKYVAKDMRDRERFFQDAADKMNKTNETIAALTQKQSDYEVAVQEINTRLATLQLANLRLAEKKRLEPEVTNADAAAALRVLAALGATKESTQGRKIIRQGSGDSFRKNSESQRLFDATQKSIAQDNKIIRQGSGDSYRKDSESRKIQPIKKSFVALENDPFHEVSPRFSDYAKTTKQVDYSRSTDLRTLAAYPVKEGAPRQKDRMVLAQYTLRLFRANLTLAGTGFIFSDVRKDTEQTLDNFQKELAKELNEMGVAFAKAKEIAQTVTVGLEG